MYLDLCGQRVPFQALESSVSREASGIAAALPHATTIVAVACDEGVVLASDRRATAENMISGKRVARKPGVRGAMTR